METFMPVPGYEGTYSVSNLGRVKSHARTTVTHNGAIRQEPEKILAGIASGPGTRYLKVNLYKDGDSKIHAVHRLVAEVFIPKLDGKNLVLHNDGNSMNNAAENLRWGSQADNLLDRRKHGWGRVGKRGAKPEIIREIKESDKTLAELAVIYGYHETTISRYRNL